MPLIGPPLTIEQYAPGYNYNIANWTRDVYDRAPAEYMDFAKVETTDRWIDQFQNVQGVPRPSLNRDLEMPPQIAPQLGYPTTIRQSSYRAQLQIEDSFFRTAAHKEIFDNATDMIESVKSMKDILGGNFFNNGFTNGLSQNIVEADGTARAFFSTGHFYESGNGTWSNYYNVLVPPNPETVYLIIKQYLMTLKDNVGNFIRFNGTFTIMTPNTRPDWGLAADEIARSATRPDTANRADNILTQGNMDTSISVKIRSKSFNNLTSTTKWYIVVDAAGRTFPLRLRELIPFEITPLERLGPGNPHVWVQTERTQFAFGFVGSYRGAVAIGT